MSTTLSDVDRTANELGRHMEVEVAAPMTFVALLEAFVDAKARAVFREEMEKAEAERRQRFEELKRTLGVPVYDEGGGGPEGREEIAQLSRAPVGEDGRIRALLGDPRDSVSVGPEGAVYQRHDAPGEGYGTINVDQQGNVTEAWVGSKPTPPAKDTGDGADSLDNVPGYILSEAGMIIKEQRATIADREARLAAATTARVEANNQWRLDYNAVADAVCRAERERDEARSSLVQTEGALREQVEGRAHWNKRAIAAESSLETAERRIGELEAFAKSFSVSVNESSFYKDVTLHLVEPHALSIRLANSKSDKAWIFADLEARRLAALTPDAGTARSEDEEE